MSPRDEGATVLIDQQGGGMDDFGSPAPSQGGLSTPIKVVIIVAVVFLCLCLVGGAATGIYVWQTGGAPADALSFLATKTGTPTATVPPTATQPATETPIPPTATEIPPTKTMAPQASDTPAAPAATDTPTGKTCDFSQAPALRGNAVYDNLSIQAEAFADGPDRTCIALVLDNPADISYAIQIDKASYGAGKATILSKGAEGFAFVVETAPEAFGVFIPVDPKTSMTVFLWFDMPVEKAIELRFQWVVEGTLNGKSVGVPLAP
jgi:hypothetical protein